MEPRELIMMQVCPVDLAFCWQTRVQLENFSKYGYDSIYHCLVFISHDKLGGGIPEYWRELEREFPKAKFFYFEDKEDFTNKFIITFNYIPLLRPYCLMKHFENHPELTKCAIYYCDSDTVFTRKLDFTPFLGDDVCYLSNTRTYNGASYFDSKSKDVLEQKRASYAKIDVLAGALKPFGLKRKTAEDNEYNTGGAQYILKNIDNTFWQDVFQGCLNVRVYLRNINMQYFASEDKGFQSWAADMWSVLWTLWARKRVTITPTELDFCWACDAINRWDETYIYHDAGANLSTPHLFNKKGPLVLHEGVMMPKYINNLGTPFEDDLSFVSKAYCSYNYVQIIESLKYKQIK